ncbi:MAG: hypothetical protein BalsKO_15960 [Balneolaceae bacterium]
MGIWAESAKTLMFNNSMLRGKTLFKVINENARYKTQSTKINPENMNFGLDLVQRRLKRRRLVFFLIIYPIVVMLFLLCLFSTHMLS